MNMDTHPAILCTADFCIDFVVGYKQN